MIFALFSSILANMAVRMCQNWIEGAGGLRGVCEFDTQIGSVNLAFSLTNRTKNSGARLGPAD
ncbi:hypothetical protein AEM38_10565 [Hyphomonadaceae bacterium UKL13-1]|nr:hypothetical protein AEM38_10565 [Hyphomonadaceae bacterium UKL13-1]